MYRCFLILSLLLIISTEVRAYMTDEQIIEYVIEATQQGKSQQQIGKELVSRGVSMQQLQRLKRMYENNSTEGIEKRKPSTGKLRNNIASQSVSTRMLSVGETSLSSRKKTSIGINSNDAIRDVDSISDNRDKRRNNTTIYGHDLFRNSNLTFEPNINSATPEDYRLGPGDEVVINIWGNNEDIIRDYISPEGVIIVENIGPVYLSGMTVKEANRHLKNVFAQKYSDISDEQSEISLTLGNLRTIQVDVMGEVEAPGTYRLSPFSTLFNALYNAGGPSEAGTLRRIEIYRSGRKISEADIYEYLFNGKISSDIKLQEGDVILVKPYEKLVTIESGVKRPMKYEIKNGESVADVISYAGGFSGDAFSDRITVIRNTGNGKTIVTVESKDFSQTELNDGDVIEVGESLDRYRNSVEIKGAVFRPGLYAINNEINTISQLLDKAEGLTEDAFLSRVQLFRLAPDRTQTVESIDLAGILSGRKPDVNLRTNDILVIPSVLDIIPQGSLEIYGAVQSPGRFPYAKGMTVADLIIQAGGLQEGASDAKIDISRRIIDADAKDVTSRIANNFTISLKNGILDTDEGNFVLQPNDIVDVRFSPSFVEQQRVLIEGEVPFSGYYTLGNRTERLSNLVERAGGISEYAYLKGAYLKRRYTEDEKIVKEETMRIAANGENQDTLSSSMLLVADYYPVGINLEKALEKPGGPDDLVLQDGDQLFIPELVNTVKITGDVLYPNSVIYKPGKKVGFYVDQAGGYGNHADKKGVYVVYMNGQVAKGRSAKVEPGCQIIIPTKEKKDTTGNLQRWLAIGSSAAALGTMAASIVNLIK